MEKKVIVISLGGSLIVPDKIDVSFLRKFRKVIEKNTGKYKFVIVCGGGSIARKYIFALREQNLNETLQSMSGIAVTRLNARFMSYIFEKDPKQGIPHDIQHVEKLLRKQKIVFCGALKYKPRQTSDGTASEIAAHFKTIFINLTNVSGLHNKNPLKYKDAKFIPEITRENLQKMVSKIKYKPGQHFIIDQNAMETIVRRRLKVYILGKNLKNLDNLLNNRKFHGTTVG